MWILLTPDEGQTAETSSRIVVYRVSVQIWKEIDHSLTRNISQIAPQVNAEVKRKWSLTSTPPYAFAAWLDMGTLPYRSNWLELWILPCILEVPNSSNLFLEYRLSWLKLFEFSSVPPRKCQGSISGHCSYTPTSFPIHCSVIILTIRHYTYNAILTGLLNTYLKTLSS